MPYANFVEIRFHAVEYPGGEVPSASTYKQLAFGAPQGGRPPLEETRLPCCSRTDGRSAAQSVRSFVTKAVSAVEGGVEGTGRDGEVGGGSAPCYVSPALTVHRDTQALLEIRSPKEG
jgi:hypothetical protein